MNDLLHHALAYRRRGMSVIPTCGKAPPEIQPGKRLRWKPYQATLPSESTLRDWFQRFEPTELAVICRRGLCVRDFDNAEAYHRWALCSDGLDQILPTVRTPRGFHVYFRNGCREIVHLSDGELRGAGYCVLPPSPGYRWLNPLPPGPVPETLPELDPAAVGLASAEQDHHPSLARARTQDTQAIGGGTYRSLTSCVAFSEIIRRTLPTEHHQRNRRIFDLARAMKGHPDYAGADPLTLGPLVERWHRAALPNISTTDFEETWSDFLHAWESVKYPIGSTSLILDRALARVEASEPPAEAAQYRCPVTARLVHICHALQVESGLENTFFLSTRTAADLLGLENNWRAWKMLRRLQRDEIIRQTRPGTRSKAPSYRYMGGRP